MAKDQGKEQAAEEVETGQEHPTIQEQADSVLSGEATLVDNGQHSAELDERRAAEEKTAEDAANAKPARKA